MTSTNEMSLHYLPCKVSGNLSSPYLLIFLHGWPDTFELWDPIISALVPEFLCVNVSYPNFATLKKEAKWGYDFPEIADALKRTIDRIDLTPNEHKTVILKEKIIVAHDWGCVYAYCFDKKYPGFVKGMVALDVAPYFTPSLFAIIYQLSLALAFMIGGIFGDSLTRKVASAFGYRSSWDKYVNSSMNYPYYYFWRNVFRSVLGREKRILERYTPSCQMTYVFGKDKPVQFQNEKWKAWVEKNKGVYMAVSGGHWIMKKHADLVVEKVKERVGKIRSML